MWSFVLTIKIEKHMAARRKHTESCIRYAVKKERGKRSSLMQSNKTPDVNELNDIGIIDANADRVRPCTALPYPLINHFTNESCIFKNTCISQFTPSYVLELIIFQADPRFVSSFSGITKASQISRKVAKQKPECSTRRS